jgi:sec-independent protein translocase protein TatC
MSTKDSAPVGGDGGRMSLIAHLEELRRRLLWILAVLAVATLVSFSFSPALFDLMRRPLLAVAGQKLQILHPLELFLTYLKVELMAGIVITVPWALFQMWMFVSPGLYRHERRWIAPFILFGSVFFVGGALFAFLVVLPYGFRYLTAMMPDGIVAQYSVEKYFSVVTGLMIAFGVVFELPLVMWILSAARLVAPATYAKFRKYWLIAAFVIGGILTPPDPFTQFMLAIPLILFFELGIIGARIVYRDDGH